MEGVNSDAWESEDDKYARKRQKLNEVDSTNWNYSRMDMDGRLGSLDIYHQFFEGLWPNPTDPWQQLGETDDLFIKRVEDSRRAYDNWMNNLIDRAFVQHQEIGIPYLTEFPPLHMSLIRDQRLDHPVMDAPVGTIILLDWFKKGIIPNAGGPRLELWNGFLQGVRFQNIVGDILLPLIQAAGIPSNNFDFIPVKPTSLWGFGGILGSIYPDAWNAQSFNPLTENGQYYGEIAGLPLVYGSQWTNNNWKKNRLKPKRDVPKNPFFPAFPFTELIDCPSPDEMTVMRKILYGIESYAWKHIPLPIKDPLLWPSQDEIRSFLQKYWPSAMQYCGLLDKVDRRFPEDWKQLLFATLINHFSVNQFENWFCRWKSTPSATEKSLFFGGLGEFLPRVTDFFKTNLLTWIDWANSNIPKGQGYPIYDFAQLLSGFPICSIVTDVFQREVNGRPLFLNPESVPKARALREHFFTYAGRYNPNYIITARCPNIEKFLDFFGIKAFSTQKQLQEAVLVICLQIIVECQNQIADPENPWFDPDEVPNWRPNYPDPSLDVHDPLVSKMYLLWRDNYDGVFTNAKTLFENIDLTGQPKYSLPRFMKSNPPGLVTNPGWIYKVREWLNLVTFSERQILLQKQWGAYVDWCIFNIRAQERADTTPDSTPYIPPGQQLVDADGVPLVYVQDGKNMPVYNCYPNFGVIVDETTETPSFIKIFGPAWYALLGDNLWGTLKGLVGEVTKLIFWALDLIGKIIQTILPSLLVVLGVVGASILGYRLLTHESNEQKSINPH